MRVATLLLVFLLMGGCGESAPTLTVVSFNAWGAGANAGESIAPTVAVLEKLDADIIALQEVRAEGSNCGPEDCAADGPSVAAQLAEAIGYEVYEQSPINEALWANAILSRYPIVSALPQELGVLVDAGGNSVAVLNVHLTDYPYQPYQLNAIEYGNAPMLDEEDVAIAAAESSRGAAIDLLLEVLEDIGEPMLTLICGDFNEPSHLDWTERAAQIGRHPLAVSYPASRKLAAAGFVDAYRSFRPDEIEFPGFTWTPSSEIDDPNEHHDRIDFVYLKGRHVRVASAAVVGESPAAADIVVRPWPSDHRAVLIRIEVPDQTPD